MDLLGTSSIIVDKAWWYQDGLKNGFSKWRDFSLVLALGRASDESLPQARATRPKKEQKGPDPRRRAFFLFLISNSLPCHCWWCLNTWNSCYWLRCLLWCYRWVWVSIFLPRWWLTRWWISWISWINY
uniref:Uncharacterized protein n=2 Tax=Picea TaxID=3328 RepID=A0A117NIZ9_PICGL|nr:hypothetical protein ABT39_MTgene639 [Picea glauca]QHR92613.1 hypothetical protein Q903MT_gene6660 [Picea sitchensis]